MWNNCMKDLEFDGINVAYGITENWVELQRQRPIIKMNRRIGRNYLN